MFLWVGKGHLVVIRQGHLGMSNTNAQGFQTFQLETFKTTDGKRMAKLKASTNFPISSYFLHLSCDILWFFGISNLNCFHHLSTDVSKKTVKVKAIFCSKEFFLCKNLSISCTTSASTDPVPVVAMSWETSHIIWYLVCVCVCQDEFLNYMLSSALSLESDHLRVPQKQCEWSKTTPWYV